MGKKFSIILLLLLIFFFSNSKPVTVITNENPTDSSYLFVTVVDSETLSALPFASVIAMSYNDKEQICSVETDINGKTALKIPPYLIDKQIILKLGYAGYNDKITNLVIGNLSEKRLL